MGRQNRLWKHCSQGCAAALRRLGAGMIFIGGSLAGRERTSHNLNVMSIVAHPERTVTSG
ncbi:hypothetical protein THIX_30116 [Thiomonas sp. X19]|nr:hypothetical protein THIX_30116 [Thiomonas sp. X19]